MEINLTFVVQSLNFFFCYQLLKRFLFKPVVDALFGEDQEKQSQLLLVHQYKKNIKQRVAYKDEQAKQCQIFVTQNYPLDMPLVACDKKDHLILKTPSVSPQSVKDLVREMGDYIVDKVDHVI